MNFLDAFDQLIYQQIHLIYQDWLTMLMIFITYFFSAITLTIFAVLLIAWFLHKKQLSKIALVIFGLGGGFLLEIVLKMLIGRLRPPVGPLLETSHIFPSFSFPSGHATLAAIFFALMIYCFKDNIKNQITRWLYIITNIILCALIGFSRLYFDYHWLSDVIGGFIIGTAWFFLILWLLQRTSRALGLTKKPNNASLRSKSYKPSQKKITKGRVRNARS